MWFSLWYLGQTSGVRMSFDDIVIEHQERMKADMVQIVTFKLSGNTISTH